jgi:hypothetical protein
VTTPEKESQVLNLSMPLSTPRLFMAGRLTAADKVGMILDSPMEGSNEYYIADEEGDNRAGSRTGGGSHLSHKKLMAEKNI